MTPVIEETLVDLAIEDPSWLAELPELERLAETAARLAIEAAGLEPRDYGVSLLACDDRRMARLNAAHRGKEGPTNVLSWPAEDLAPETEGDAPPPPSPPDRPDDEPESLGDVALAWETVAREAEAQGLAPADHAFHLLVHGALHLLGYDHERDGDAARMEALESRICLAEGLRDPYLAQVEGTPRLGAAAGSERSHGR